MAATFWMVLGSGEPRFRHTSKASALREAQRLALQNPGVEFVVLESVRSVEHRVFLWQDFTPEPGSADVPDDEVPF